MRKQLIEEIEWQEKKLKEARETIGNMPIIMPYDNGGGQTGIRKNPAYEAYESLFSAYLRGCASIDGDYESSEGASITPLEVIRGKYKGRGAASTG